MKKIMAFLLALVLIIGSLAACGNSEEAPAETKTPVASTQDDTAAAPETVEEEEVEDVAEIEILFWTLNSVPGDLDMVEDAINAITEEKINTIINLNIVDMGSYAQQVNLAVSSGEKLDLMVTLPGDTAHFNAMTSQKQLLGISDLLTEYAPELLETLPEGWLDGTTVDGEIYSVTSMGDKATPLCFVCRTDILEKTGIDPSTIKNANDLTELFAKVLEVEPTINPLCGGNKGFLTSPAMIDAEGNFFSYDGLGEGNNTIVSIMPGDGSKISMRYETEEYAATTKWITDWYNAGYVDKDLANKDESAESTMQTGTAFGFFKLVSGGEYGAASVAAGCGHDVTIIPLDDAVITTGMMRKFTWAVPQCATEPEAAVKFMNLLYTDAEVLNLITWGIEGVHYQTMEDGTIDFLEGQDASNCGYFLGDCSSILGNGFLAKVRHGQPANYREMIYELNTNATVSEFLGFGINTTDMDNMITALTSVINEVRPAVASGIGGQEGVETLISKLKTADVDAYVAAVQQQLDEWIAANK